MVSLARVKLSEATALVWVTMQCTLWVNGSGFIGPSTLPPSLRFRSSTQEAKLSFLCRVSSCSLTDKVGNSEICFSSSSNVHVFNPLRSNPAPEHRHETLNSCCDKTGSKQSSFQLGQTAQTSNSIKIVFLCCFCFYLLPNKTRFMMNHFRHHFLSIFYAFAAHSVNVL